MPWRVLAAKPGPFQVTLDRTDAAQGASSLHGVYCFQVRLRIVKAAAEASRVGLAKLGFVAFFENGIMSIPQIFAGDNTIRFKVEDASQVRSDIQCDSLLADGGWTEVELHETYSPVVVFQRQRSRLQRFRPGSEALYQPGD